jgi:hypothetical protein
MDGSLIPGGHKVSDALMDGAAGRPTLADQHFADIRMSDVGAAAEESRPHPFADRPVRASQTPAVSEPREGQPSADHDLVDSQTRHVGDASGLAHVDDQRANAAGDDFADHNSLAIQGDHVGDASDQLLDVTLRTDVASDSIASAIDAQSSSRRMPKHSRRKAGDQSSATIAPTTPGPLSSQTAEGGFPLGTLIELWRQRQDLTRARQRIDLQCQAICRRICGGDKGEAAKLWKAMQADPSAVFIPYLSALAPLDEMAAALEKPIRKLGKQHPLWDRFARDVKGFGELRFAGIIAEAGRPISDYRGPAALWSRFRLGVEDGKRQTLGASPARGALVWNLGGELLKGQGKDEKAGPYRQIYDRRKAYLIEQERPHPHASAARYMVKAIMKDLWRASRDLKGESHV